MEINVDSILANFVETEQLTAESFQSNSATISSLTSSSIITNNLVCANGNVDVINFNELDVDNITTQNLDTMNTTITTANISTLDVTTLTTSNAVIQSLFSVTQNITTQTDTNTSSETTNSINLTLAERITIAIAVVVAIAVIVTAAVILTGGIGAAAGASAGGNLVAVSVGGGGSALSAGSVQANALAITAISVAFAESALVNDYAVVNQDSSTFFTFPVNFSYLVDITQFDTATVPYFKQIFSTIPKLISFNTTLDAFDDGNAFGAQEATLSLCTNTGSRTLRFQDDGDLAIYSTPSTQLWHTNTQISDVRMKKNLVPLENSLDKICQMNGVYFNYISEEFGDVNVRSAGLIAQELIDIVPEAVDNARNILNVDLLQIIPLLIESVKILEEEFKQINESITRRQSEHE